VNCDSETWVLKENIIQKLLVFERKSLRRILEPTKENQTWVLKENIIQKLLVFERKSLRRILEPTKENQTWVLKENIIQKLLVFERKSLRRILEPTKENQTWRIKNNEELDKLIKHENTVNCIKVQRLSRFSHIERMPEARATKKIFKWNPLTARTGGRPKYRWEDNLQDLGQMDIKNWLTCVQDRAKWKDVVEKAKTYN